MLFRFILLMALLISSERGHIAICAPSATPTPTPPPNQTAKVEGHVFDAHTKAPLAGVKVWFDGYNDGFFETKTDSTGYYHLDHVTQGKYIYNAEVRGYSGRSNYGWRGKASEADLQVSAQGLKFDIALVHQGRIRGQVRDMHGSPVVGAIVRAYPTNAEVDTQGQTKTDNNGRFSIRELDVLHPRKDAIYEVEVSKTGLSKDLKKLRVRPFYNASDESHVALTMKPLAVISGQLTFKGRPFKNGRVIINSDDGNEIPSISTEKNGRYNLRVSAPATYQLTFYGDDVVDQTVQVRVQPGRLSVFNRDLKPFPYGSIRGRVVNLKGQPVKGADIELWTERTSETDPVATTDKNGRFFVSKVRPYADYRIAVTMPKSSLRGGVDKEGVKVSSYRTTNVTLYGDTVRPRLQILEAPRVLNGLVKIRFKATDNQGIRFITPHFDGQYINDGKKLLGIDFDHPKGPRQTTGTFIWNSRNAFNGLHRLSVEVNDMAGNTAKVEWQVWVQGSPKRKATPKSQLAPPSNGKVGY